MGRGGTGSGSDGARQDMTVGRELAVHRFSSIEALPAPYMKLFAEAEHQSFFLSIDWFRNFERTVADSTRTVVVYGVQQRGPNEHRAVGALVLWRYRRSEGPVSVHRLESLGNYYTSYFAPVASTSAAETADICRALASAVWSDRNQWDEFYLQPLDPFAPAYEALVGLLRERGLIVQSFPCFGNWYLDVGGRSYTEYVRDLPSVVRKNLPYNARRLERSFRVRHELVTATAGLEEALDDYARIYATTWKPIEPYPG